MNIEKLEAFCDDLRRKEATLVSDEQRLCEAELDLVACGKVHEIITSHALAVQRIVHVKISQLVTRCLAFVFEDPYDFEIRFNQKRSTTEAQIIFIRDGIECDPLTASGGGVVDVATFALRLACLMLKRPKCRRLLVLDEPFRFVSVQYRNKLTQLLTSLNEEFGVQFVLVTHIDELRLGDVVSLSKE